MSAPHSSSVRSTLARIRAGFSFAWRWSLLITVPVGSVFLLWVSRASERYLNFGVDFKSLNDALDLKRIGSLEARGILRDIELAARPRTRSETGGIRTLNLYVPESSEKALLSDLPFSGRHYVEASFAYPDGEIRDVRVKMRGDHFWHWGGRKQSLRVKTKKKALFERLRAINLNAPKMPDQVSGHLSLHLAGEMGLITPRTDFVELRINGRNRGVYLFFEQMEEMTIRTHGRMPGDLYSGDIVSRNKYAGVPTNIFENEGLWEKIAINNHFAVEENAALVQLVALLGEDVSAARSEAFAALVDIEEFGNYAAFRALCETYHYGNTHNWRLYYDPWRNRFVPAVWDPVGWHLAWRPKRGAKAAPDLITSRMDEVLLEDNAFIVARQRAMDRFYETGMDVSLVEYLDDLLVRVGPAIERDPGLCYVATMLTPAEVREAQAVLRKVVIQIFQDQEDEYRTPGVIEYSVSGSDPAALRLRVDGRRPFESVALDLVRPPDGRLTGTISWIGPAGPETADVSGAVIQQGSRVTIDVPLVAQFVRTVAPGGPVRMRNIISVEPATYDLTLRGGGFDGNSIVSVAGLLPDGTRVGASRLESIEPSVLSQSAVAVRARPLRTPLTWSGTVTLEGVQTIEDDVIIEPGTEIRMGPSASVIIEGRVTAIGTEASPIRVVPIEEGQDPWGTFAIRGHGADGSEFAWCNLGLGSGYKVPLSEYSAMFSVHDVDDVVVRDCMFRDSRVVDDMVHVVYSTIRFEDCTFVRSLFDALDIDISEAVVDRCQFIEAGNDALDLMTSTVVVRDSLILKSSDKAISIGEDSRAFVLNTTLKDGLLNSVRVAREQAGEVLEDGAIGVQIKDRSQAILVNCSILGNAMGIDAYKKNWRYDSGGYCYVYKSVIQGNESQLTADKHSRILVHDSLVDPMVVPSKRIYLDEYCDSGPKRKASSRRLTRFPDEERLDVDMFRPHWADVEVRGRGARARQ